MDVEFAISELISLCHVLMLEVERAMSYKGQTSQNGKYNGYGHYVWEDGSSYTGFWEDGEFHGKGTYYWPDGG